MPLSSYTGNDQLYFFALEREGYMKWTSFHLLNMLSLNTSAYLDLYFEVIWNKLLLSPNIQTLILPTCPEQNVWTVLGELVVRQTLTPTRDHLPNSPYCTTQLAINWKEKFAFDRLLGLKVLVLYLISQCFERMWQENVSIFLICLDFLHRLNVFCEGNLSFIQRYMCAVTLCTQLAKFK